VSNTDEWTGRGVIVCGVAGGSECCVYCQLARAISDSVAVRQARRTADKQVLAGVIDSSAAAVSVISRD